MKNIYQRLDEILPKIVEPNFRKNKGLGSEIGFYVFDYKAEEELLVRDRIRYIKEKSVEEQFDYPFEKKGGTIRGLLSSNQSLIRLYNAYADARYNLHFCFQFKEARTHFKVIEDNTKTLIVPHGGGKELINDLNSSLNIEGKISALKKVQVYSVNIFEHKFKKLDEMGAISICDVEGVYILNDGFYNGNIGVVLEKELKLITL